MFLEEFDGTYREMTDEEFKRKLTMAGHTDEPAQISLADKNKTVTDKKITYLQKMDLIIELHTLRIPTEIISKR